MTWSKLADVAQVAVGVMVILAFAVVLILAVAARDARASEVPAKVPTSSEIYDWCESQFPYRDDLQHACRLGADEQSSR